MKTVNCDSLGKSHKKLIAAAEAVMKTSYSPYSGFAVGAALMTLRGRIVTGSNVENAAYGLTICAERAALVRANAMGERVFSSLAVVAGL
ncbi:MAG: cytidine deaminase, partial [bacterium]